MPRLEKTHLQDKPEVFETSEESKCWATWATGESGNIYFGSAHTKFFSKNTISTTVMTHKLFSSYVSGSSD